MPDNIAVQPLMSGVLSPILVVAVTILKSGNVVTLKKALEP
jgi:hypothetical protein